MELATVQSRDYTTRNRSSSTGDSLMMQLEVVEMSRKGVGGGQNNSPQLLLLHLLIKLLYTVVDANDDSEWWWWC